MILNSKAHHALPSAASAAGNCSRILCVCTSDTAARTGTVMSEYITPARAQTHGKEAKSDTTEGNQTKHKQSSGRRRGTHGGVVPEALQGPCSHIQPQFYYVALYDPNTQSEPGVGFSVCQNESKNSG